MKSILCVAGSSYELNKMGVELVACSIAIRLKTEGGL